MTEYHNIDYTMTLDNEKIDDERIYNIIKNHVNNYIMIYKKKPHIYVSVDCISFLLFGVDFKMKSLKLSKPYIGILCECYIYVVNELDKNDFYLSDNNINYKQFKRKLKIEQLNNSSYENSKI